MLRDSAFRYAHQMPLLTEDDVAMTHRAAEQRLRLVECRPVHLMESMPTFTVAQAIEIEGEGYKSGIVTLALLVRSTVRLDFG